MTQLQAIKNEIERRTSLYLDPFHIDDTHYRVKASELKDLLSFIESLEKEEAREVTSRHKQTQGCRGLSQVVEDKDTNNTIILQPQGLDDAVWEQMENDGDVDHFVRKELDEIALKYARLGAKWMDGAYLSAKKIRELGRIILKYNTRNIDDSRG